MKAFWWVLSISVGVAFWVMVGMVAVHFAVKYW